MKFLFVVKNVFKCINYSLLKKIWKYDKINHLQWGGIPSFVKVFLLWKITTNEWIIVFWWKYKNMSKFIIRWVWTRLPCKKSFWCGKCNQIINYSLLMKIRNNDKTHFYGGGLDLFVKKSFRSGKCVKSMNYSLLIKIWKYVKIYFQWGLTQFFIKKSFWRGKCLKMHEL